VDDFKPNFLSRDEALLAGYELARYDELFSCERKESLSFEFLENIMKEFVLPHVKKGKALKEQRQIYNEFMVLQCVEYWREQGLIKSPPKVREARKIAREWRQSICPQKEPPEISVARKFVQKWELKRHLAIEKGQPRPKTPDSVDAARGVWWKWLDWQQKYPRELHATTEKIWQWYQHGSPRPITRDMHNAFVAMNQWRECGLGARTPPPPDVQRAFAVVKKWNEQGIKKARHGKFSDNKIRERVGKELHMSPSKVWRLLQRAEKRNKEGFYIAEMFMRSIVPGSPKTFQKPRKIETVLRRLPPPT